MVKIIARFVLVAYVLTWSTLAVAEDSYFDSGGTRIRYIDEGAGSTVLLLHGFTTNLEIAWIESGFYQALISAGFRVVTYDHRGHGKSASPTEPEQYGVEMVEDARRLLDHLEKPSSS